MKSSVDGVKDCKYLDYSATKVFIEKIEKKNIFSKKLNFVGIEYRDKSKNKLSREEKVAISSHDILFP